MGVADDRTRRVAVHQVDNVRSWPLQSQQNLLGERTHSVCRRGSVNQTQHICDVGRADCRDGLDHTGTLAGRCEDPERQTGSATLCGAEEPLLPTPPADDAEPLPLDDPAGGATNL